MFKRPETQMPTSSSRGKETGVFPRMERQTAKRASTAPITAGVGLTHVIMGERGQKMRRMEHTLSDPIHRKTKGRQRYVAPEVGPVAKNGTRRHGGGFYSVSCLGC